MFVFKFAVLFENVLILAYLLPHLCIVKGNELACDDVTYC